MKLSNRFYWIVVFFVTAFVSAGLTHAEVNTPRIGLVRYADGSVWVMNGLRANFVLATRLFTATKEACFSDVGGLVAIPGEIELVTLEGSVVGRYRTEEAQPVLRIDKNLSSATIWLPSTKTMLRWNGKSFTAAEGEAPDPAFRQKSFLLFSDASGFEVQAADGNTRTLPIKATDIKMQRMSGDWVHLSSNSLHRDWALFLGGSDVQLSELPAAQETSK